MDLQIIEKFWEVFDKIPVHAQAIIITILFVIVLLTSKGGLQLIQKIAGTHIKKRTKLKETDLRKHDLFSNYPHFLQMAKMMTFENSAKTFVFRTIITQKLMAVKEVMFAFISQNHVNHYDTREFNRQLKLIVQRIIDTYNATILHDFQSKFGEIKGRKIFDIVMNAETPERRGFNIWHKTQVKEVFKVTDYLCDAEFLDNNLERIHLFMYEINRAMYFALMETKPFYNQFNGELNALILE